jgi:hypothetical protein
LPLIRRQSMIGNQVKQMTSQLKKENYGRTSQLRSNGPAVSISISSLINDVTRKPTTITTHCIYVSNDYCFTQLHDTTHCMKEFEMAHVKLPLHICALQYPVRMPLNLNESSPSMLKTVPNFPNAIRYRKSVLSNRDCWPIWPYLSHRAKVKSESFGLCDH